MIQITELLVEPLDLELTEPFGIATGAQERAKNVLLTLVFSDGTRGLGEAAPFPAVNGETQEQVIAALERARPELIGTSLEPWRDASAKARELLKGTPSALCAFETALLDALGKRMNFGLIAFFGGKQGRMTTDITIPTGTVEHAAESAARAARDGFSTLKVKVGGATEELDSERLDAIARQAPNANWVLDGNAAFEARGALALLDRLGRNRARVALFEQPTAADDLEGLADVRAHGNVRVAADESARSRDDVVQLSRKGAADVINIKITKTGVVEALAMIDAARSAKLGLMIGGMVESILCMTMSACLAGGLGDFEFVDLDTPLFIAKHPFSGGFTQTGPNLNVWRIKKGHGVELAGK